MPHWTRNVAVLAASLALASTAAADEASPERDELIEQTTECLAEAVYFEARGTSERSQTAVAHVVLNRTEDAEFPDTVCGVVAERCQFSYRCDGRPEAMAEAGDRAEAYRTAALVLDGDAPDPTGGALFFHADELEPGWFASRSRTTAIGGHIYYR